MSLLSELNTLLADCGISVETGIFSDKAPDSYLVITPLTETLALRAARRRKHGYLCIPRAATPS